MKNSGYIIINDNGVNHLLPVEEILHIKAVRVYSIVYMKDRKRQYVSSHHLGHISNELDPEIFFRVHKSHLVNLREIKSYQEGRGGKILLSDNTSIDVAQRRKTELLLHLRHLNKKAKQLPASQTHSPHSTLTPKRPSQR